MISAPVLDHRGQLLTTASLAAAVAYSDAVEAALSGRPTACRMFTQAIVADRGLALAHIGLAWTYWDRDAGRALEAIVSGVPDIERAASRREQQHIEIVRLAITGKGHLASALIVDHLAEFPDDLLPLHAVAMAGHRAARPPTTFVRRHPRAHDSSACGLAALTLLDAGARDEASALARHALRIDPCNRQAAHVLAHLAGTECGR